LILGYLCLARTLFCVNDPLLRRQTLIHDAVAKLNIEIVNRSAMAYLSSPKHLPSEQVWGLVSRLPCLMSVLFPLLI